MQPPPLALRPLPVFAPLLPLPLLAPLTIDRSHSRTLGRKLGVTLTVLQTCVPPQRLPLLSLLPPALGLLQARSAPLLGHLLTPCTLARSLLRLGVALRPALGVPLHDMRSAGWIDPAAVVAVPCARLAGREVERCDAARLRVRTAGGSAAGGTRLALREHACADTKAHLDCDADRKPHPVTARHLLHYIV